MNQWLLVRRLKAPAFLMLIGVMALLNESGVLGWHRSWPLLLILAGLLSLAERAAVARVDQSQFYPQAAVVYQPYPGTASTAPPVASTGLATHPTDAGNDPAQGGL